MAPILPGISNVFPTLDAGTWVMDAEDVPAPESREVRSVHVRQRLPHGAQAPSAARELVDAALADRVSEEALDGVRLLVSELVTNAVLHGRKRRGGIELVVALRGCKTRVEVTDGGAGFEPPGAPPRPEHPGGWGLIVVDRLATRWGVAGGRMTRVWAELEVDAIATRASPATAPVYARNV
jgi:anti-sigma regulatory factor (Ser/Thr protein kinase)